MFKELIRSDLVRNVQVGSLELARINKQKLAHAYRESMGTALEETVDQRGFELQLVSSFIELRHQEGEEDAIGGYAKVRAR